MEEIVIASVAGLGNILKTDVDFSISFKETGKQALQLEKQTIGKTESLFKTTERFPKTAHPAGTVSVTPAVFPLKKR